jgi:uncharacterized protein YjbI with pentapeptide repeats
LATLLTYLETKGYQMQFTSDELAAQLKQPAPIQLGKADLSMANLSLANLIMANLSGAKLNGLT